MDELEIAILIVVSFLLLLSIASMVINWKGKRRAGYNYKYLRKDPKYSSKSAPGLEGYKAGDIKSTVRNTDWQQEINKIGVDPATKFSHKEWTSELLGRTTGASPWTVRDDDINSNWLGLGWGKTWKQVYAQPGARVSESNDWQDMPSNPSIRFRCHEYISDPVKPADCPWPPQSNQRF